MVIWCDHHCKCCHNKITWDPSDGLEFDHNTENELISELREDHISGLTLSGGDPLFYRNREDVLYLLRRLWTWDFMKDKDVWLYTGYTWEEILNLKSEDYYVENILSFIDVLVDGRFIKELKDENYPWAGSTNQRIIDVKKSLEEGEITYYGNYQEGWNNRGIQAGKNYRCCI